MVFPVPAIVNQNQPFLAMNFPHSFRYTYSEGGVGSPPSHYSPESLSVGYTKLSQLKHAFLFSWLICRVCASGLSTARCISHKTPPTIPPYPSHQHNASLAIFPSWTIDTTLPQWYHIPPTQSAELPLSQPLCLLLIYHHAISKLVLWEPPRLVEGFHDGICIKYQIDMVGIYLRGNQCGRQTICAGGLGRLQRHLERGCPELRVDRGYGNEGWRLRREGLYNSHHQLWRRRWLEDSVEVPSELDQCLKKPGVRSMSTSQMWTLRIRRSVWAYNITWDPSPAHNDLSGRIWQFW